MLALARVTLIVLTAAGAGAVTVTVTDALTVPTAAVTVAVPAPLAVTSPPETVATVASDVVQVNVAEDVTSTPAEFFAVAESVVVAPTNSAGTDDGDSTMDATVVFGGGGGGGVVVPVESLPPHPNSTAAARSAAEIERSLRMDCLKMLVGENRDAGAAKVGLLRLQLGAAFVNDEAARTRSGCLRHAIQATPQASA